MSVTATLNGKRIKRMLVVLTERQAQLQPELIERFRDMGAEVVVSRPAPEAVEVAVRVIQEDRPKHRRRR